MKNPFTINSFPLVKKKRNAFDLGRRSVFTSDFFKIYPYFCTEVLPDDSFEINARVGIRGMPTQFPIQTRIRISTEFYLIRNRTLDRGFEDRIFKNKNTEFPWLRLNNQRAKKMISTGSLGDALGVPTTVGSQRVVSLSISFSAPYYDSNRPLTVPTGLNTLYELFAVGRVPMVIGGSSSHSVYSTTYNQNAYSSFRYSNILDKPLDSDSIEDLSFDFTSSPSVYPSVSIDQFITGIMTSSGEVLYYYRTPLTLASSSSDKNLFFGSSNVLDKFNEFLEIHKQLRLFIAFAYSYSNNGNFGQGASSGDSYVVYWPNISTPVSTAHPAVNYSVSNAFFDSEVVDATDDSVIASNPFIGNSPKIRINSLPFRAYEMLSNYYYRSDRNNPYILNGEAQYNEFIPTHEYGPDDNVYDFHYRNWEMDRFTSALQTPQMGEAPLVGVIFTGDRKAALTFDGSLDGEQREIKVEVGLDEDDNVEQILNFDKELPSADLQRLQQRIQAGFSINQFRVTNSFQRFLENSLFRGRRYRNQMKSHFNVSVDYPDIDVPQYIGGSSSILDVGQVTNTADSPNAGLGDYIGTLQGGVSTNHSIRCYSPEHGFIIGVVSFYPIPSYAQSIAKHLIKRDALDYFSPEFGKIGFVPVRYSELSPLQTGSGQDVNDVFGYQKAHYDYMSALDEVHGDFRTTLHQFVCTRTFAQRPELSASFIEGRPDQLNDIFVAQNIVDAYGSSAKFLCSSDVSCKVLRQIPIVGTPSLE